MASGIWPKEAVGKKGLKKEQGTLKPYFCALLYFIVLGLSFQPLEGNDQIYEILQEISKH